MKRAYLSNSENKLLSIFKVLYCFLKNSRFGNIVFLKTHKKNKKKDWNRYYTGINGNIKKQ